MNFQAIEQGNGNLVVMFGVITEFSGEGINPKSSKPWKKAKIRDDAGVTHTVTLRGELPSVAIINQRTQFNLSTYQGTSQGQSYTGYSGFWNKNAQTSQTAPQQPQQATGQPKANNGDRDMRIVRGNSLNAIMSAAEIPLDMVGKYLYSGVQFILTGKWEMKPFSNAPEPDQNITEDLPI